MEDFEAVAARGTQTGFVSDLYYFIRHNKKWWVSALVLVMLMFGGLMMLAGTGAAPFIYTLF